GSGSTWTGRARSARPGRRVPHPAQPPGRLHTEQDRTCLGSLKSTHASSFAAGRHASATTNTAGTAPSSATEETRPRSQPSRMPMTNPPHRCPRPKDTVTERTPCSTKKFGVRPGLFPNFFGFRGSALSPGPPAGLESPDHVPDPEGRPMRLRALVALLALS